MSKTPKTDNLFVRISSDVKERFTKRAADADLTASELVRELVTGFVEGRVTIIPPENPKESIYVTRNPGG